MSVYQLFFELLQVAIGTRDGMSRVPTAEEWYALYDLADKHSVVGFCFGGIEKLAKDARPPRQLFMPWMGEAESVKEQNRTVDTATLTTIARFQDFGYRCCVLKGQALARLYPRPELRASGDIDLLIGDCMPSDEMIKRACEMAVDNRTEYLHATYHHCDYGMVDDTEVEIHWRASWFYTPWYNKRFQRFCHEQCVKSDFITKDELSGILVPSLDFDLVFVLVHVYRHLFNEGIGLRQLLDYYMVQRRLDTSKEETMRVLRRLGMSRFTAAVMWVMKERLGMTDECLLCEPNEKDGRFLLGEVMQGGNFGQHDERYAQREGESYFKFALRKLRRNMTIFRFGGWEMTFTPLWRFWHIYWWMRKHNEKVKLE